MGEEAMHNLLLQVSSSDLKDLFVLQLLLNPSTQVLLERAHSSLLKLIFLVVRSELVISEVGNSFFSVVYSSGMRNSKHILS